MKRPKEKLVLGIDLGTTYSSVGVFKNRQVEVIGDYVSKKSIPSFVTFTNEEILCGTVAKHEALNNENAFVYDSKRMIGRKYSDKVVQEGIKVWPFKVIRGCGNIPKIQVRYNKYKKNCLPEEISAIILKELKNTAGEYYSTNIEEAVITVPADFNNNQRALTRKAGELAGLKVLRIVDEPTAAAIAYGMNENIDTKKTILVFDFGGGTLDVSLIEATKSQSITDEKILGCQVIATAGDQNLGGQDFDNNLIHHFARIFKDKYNCDFLQDQRAKLIMKDKCESAKISLSCGLETTIWVPSLYNGKDFSCKISRSDFEKINSMLFDRILDPIKQILDDKQLSKKSIDEYILVGGSSNIPCVQKILKEFFDGKDPAQFQRSNVSMEYAVVHGAAIIANNMGNVTINSVISHSLGVELHGGKMETLIKKNEKIPAMKEDLYTTATNYQDKVEIKIFSGEKEMVNQNTYIGSVSLRGIFRGVSGEPQIKILFKVDEEGILKVYTKDTKTGAEKRCNFEI
ncbi:cytoplasmic heat shock protein 70 [Histomonas meleagridis]|uniref:cytoplasmic heat shock protein 70 n=1 Tax=Histomonas meleagridis TaxID=135588 RepID=UPI00355A3C84|nr:cytoplasmic heat shock protein 70 [Histomonas meleagridis]KAH0804053.1 cytoplasmic heat shock protein 70 [Histomonas meleagridis]